MNTERCGTCYRRLRDGRCPVHGPEDDPPPPEPIRLPGGTLDLFGGDDLQPVPLRNQAPGSGLAARMARRPRFHTALFAEAA